MLHHRFDYADICIDFSVTTLTPSFPPLRDFNWLLISGSSQTSSQGTMTAPATEIALIPLQIGATIEDADSPAGQIWKSTLDTVKAQEGFQRCYYGREVEATNKLHFFVGKTAARHSPFVHSRSIPFFAFPIL